MTILGRGVKALSLRCLLLHLISARFLLIVHRLLCQAAYTFVPSTQFAVALDTALPLLGVAASIEERLHLVEDSSLDDGSSDAMAAYLEHCSLQSSDRNLRGVVNQNSASSSGLQCDGSQQRLGRIEPSYPHVFECRERWGDLLWLTPLPNDTIITECNRRCLSASRHWSLCCPCRAAFGIPTISVISD